MSERNVTRTVIVALDGSREAARAVPLARAVAAQLGASLAAVHVAAPGMDEGAARASAGLDAPGLEDVTLRARTGDVAQAILDEIARPDVVLAVMTTVAAGDPERALGGIAMTVLTNTTRPVIVLRPECGCDPADTATPLTHLLVPLDGTRETAWALRPAAPLALELGAALDVLYIATLGDGRPAQPDAVIGARYVDQSHHEWRTWSGEMQQRLLFECAGVSPSLEVSVFVQAGEPGREIVRFAQEHRDDAIVLVRQSKLEAGRAETLRHVLREASCPLLVVGGAP